MDMVLSWCPGSYIMVRTSSSSPCWQCGWWADGKAAKGGSWQTACLLFFPACAALYVRPVT